MTTHETTTPEATTTVYVPLGWRSDAARAVPIAAEVARLHDAELELVHVAIELDDDSPSARSRTWMKPLADDHGATLRLVEHKSVSEALRDVVADDPQAMICMVVDASGGAADLVLGSISEDMLRAGHQRFVLIGPNVPEGATITDKPAVVCVDGSDHAESILPTADGWAAATNAVPWVVAVTDSTPLPEDTNETSYVQSAAHRLAHEQPEWEVLHGRDHARSITDFAEARGAGSIVMATHGRTGLDRLLMGSVTIRVVHQARCPVLVRRPPALSIVEADASDRSHAPT